MTMRKDEQDNDCPATLGEYLDFCAALMPGSKAVAFLQKKIDESPGGRDEIVIADDSQMRVLLYPMLLE